MSQILKKISFVNRMERKQVGNEKAKEILRKGVHKHNKLNFLQIILCQVVIMRKFTKFYLLGN